MIYPEFFTSQQCAHPPIAIANTVLAYFIDAFFEMGPPRATRAIAIIGRVDQKDTASPPYRRIPLTTRRKLDERIALPGTIGAGDIADLVSLLVSLCFAKIAGQVLRIDRGMPF